MKIKMLGFTTQKNKMLYAPPALENSDSNRRANALQVTVL